MIRIRTAEETVARYYPEQEMRTPTHFSIGQEAVSVGVCEALLYALRYDSNTGVRLKALDSLGPFVKDDVQVRDAVLESLIRRALESNLALSQQRAAAVSKALATRYKIDAKRLQAKGVASLAPVASNASEDGRARNRRVELVVQ